MQTSLFDNQGQGAATEPPRVEIEKLPTKRQGTERVKFNGIIYRRYPDATNFSDAHYFRCSHGDKLRGYGSLHRDVYKSVYGDIPDGWHIHHKDGDALNNAPENLEALPPTEHNERHVPSARQRQAIAYKETPEHRERMRRGAAEWHRSEEGKAWHSQNAKEGWLNVPEIAKRCEQCLSEYIVKSISPENPRFCSNKCKSAYRRQSGVDNEERTCPCGKTFTVNRYDKTATCSRSCSARYRPRGWAVGRGKSACSG